MFEFDDLEELEAQQEQLAPKQDEEATAKKHIASDSGAVTGQESGAAGAAGRAASDLKNKDPGARWEACRELARLGASALPFLSELERLAQDEIDDDMRRAAKKALRELCIDSGAAHPSAETVQAVLMSQEKRTVSSAIAAAAATTVLLAASHAAPATQSSAAAAQYEIKEYELERRERSGKAKERDGPAYLHLLRTRNKVDVRGDGGGEGLRGGELQEQQASSSHLDSSRGTKQDPLGELGRHPNSKEPHQSDRADRQDPHSNQLSAEDEAGEYETKPPPKFTPAPRSWLEGREGRASRRLPSPKPMQEFPVDPLQLNFKMLMSKKHIEVLQMRVEREEMAPAEISDIWEQCWGVRYAGRVRFEAPPGGPTKWLHPHESTVPSSPHVVRLDATGSILYTLSAALRQYGALSASEALAAREQRQRQALLDASKREDADTRESKRYIGLGIRQRYDNRQR